jgi:Na+-translocating ferredoxin:NAD+ oxidoreductase RnfG subunit
MRRIALKTGLLLCIVAAVATLLPHFVATLTDEGRYAL